MKTTIKIPMLIGPGGYYYAYGFGDAEGPGDVDLGVMLDVSDEWPCDQTMVRRVDVVADVDFPDAEIPAVPAVVKQPDPALDGLKELIRMHESGECPLPDDVLEIARAGVANSA